MKIVAASIGPMPKGICDPMPVVRVKFEDGSEKTLFDFFPDEISFSESEFIGLTEDEARSMKFKKDQAFLAS